jgi:serine/threonine protein kinase
MRPHPNIVQILGVSVDGPHLVMIIEYCDGGKKFNLIMLTIE